VTAKNIWITFMGTHCSINATSTSYYCLWYEQRTWNLWQLIWYSETIQQLFITTDHFCYS